MANDESHLLFNIKKSTSLKPSILSTQKNVLVLRLEV